MLTILCLTGLSYLYTLFLYEALFIVSIETGNEVHSNGSDGVFWAFLHWNIFLLQYKVWGNKTFLLKYLKYGATRPLCLST